MINQYTHKSLATDNLHKIKCKVANAVYHLKDEAKIKELASLLSLTPNKRSVM